MAVNTLEHDPAGDQRLRVRNMSWSSFQLLAKAFNGRHARLAFDRGSLEIMTISRLHAALSSLIHLLIAVLTEETDTPRASCGDMTCGREDLERSIEPDECYYLENEPLVRGKEEIDFRVDPPPDLAVEVEVSRGLVNRLGIYEALRISELWHWKEGHCTFYNLDDGGSYVPVQHSRHFPFLTPADLDRFINQWNQVEESKLVASFREWVRLNVG